MVIKRESAAIATLVLLLATTIATTATALGSDELYVVVSPRLSSRPLALVKLEVSLPHVDADDRAVIVRRFPTPYSLAEDGYTELIYLSTHTPGTTVTVRSTLPTPAGYYEPQEYLVPATYRKDGSGVLNWGRVVEVLPRGKVHVEKVRVGEEVPQVLSSGSAGSVGSWEGVVDAFECRIHIKEVDLRRKVGECRTWVRGPRIYSLDGLETSFILYAYPKPSVVYLEAFYDFDRGPVLRDEGEVRWRSAGRWLTRMAAPRTPPPHWIYFSETSPLTGNYSDRVYLRVVYVYEFYRDCHAPLSCYQYWLLYPAVVEDVVRSGENPLLPHEVEPYSPPPPPWHAISATPGTVIIGFAVPYETVETDVSIANTTITFRYEGFWEASLAVDFYKAVREDRQYATPAVKVVSTRYYWWWYRDNDEATCEILLAPREVLIAPKALEANPRSSWRDEEGTYIVP